MVHFFGKIADSAMVLSEIGLLAEKYWLEIPVHFPFVELGEFVVMPNHMHGIIIINNPDADPNPIFTGTTRFQNQGKNTISSIIGSYKSIVSKRANLLPTCKEKAPPFLHPWAWKPGFHDHIIKDHDSFTRIQNYIVNNPINWKEDKFNTGTNG